MKLGGILGIIGAVIALIVGVIGFQLAGAGSSVMSGIASFNADANSARVNAEAQSYLAFYQVMAIVMPIVGLLGGGWAFRNAKIGGGLMAVSALGILWAFGFGVFSGTSIVLLGIGAAFSLMGEQKPEGRS